VTIRTPKAILKPAISLRLAAAAPIGAAATAEATGKALEEAAAPAPAIDEAAGIALAEAAVTQETPTFAAIEAAAGTEETTDAEETAVPTAAAATGIATWDVSHPQIANGSGPIPV
jgi:hypothetical protein